MWRLRCDMNGTAAPAARAPGMPPQRADSLANTPEVLHVLVLVGMIGSGKSTFAAAVADTLGWIRCNQDELGQRYKVVAAAERALASGRSIVIDRTNLDASQRAHWIDVARAFHAAHPHTHVDVSVIELYVPHEVAHARLAHRTNHPTLRTPEDAHRYAAADSVLGMCKRAYQPPRATAPEGFDRMLVVRGDELDLSNAQRAATVHSVIHALYESPALPPADESYMRAVRSRARAPRPPPRGARSSRATPASAASPASRHPPPERAHPQVGECARGPQSRP